MKLQNINAIKIIVAVIRLFSKDVRANGGHTNRYGQLAACRLKLNIEKLLRIIIALATQPVVL